MIAEDVRAELQLSTYILPDSAINYALGKFSSADDPNLVYAEVLRMVLRKHRGVVRRRIGKFEETIDPQEIRREINRYMAKAASYIADDNFSYGDAFFDRTDSKVKGVSE